MSTLVNTTEQEVSRTLVAQLAAQLLDEGPQLRARELPYTANLEGEGAIDAGGPYYETMSQMATELMSSALPLFMPTPNGREQHGESQNAMMVCMPATLTRCHAPNHP